MEESVRNSVAGGRGEPVAFGRKLAGSEAFKAMFNEGMALVEQTAAYLDGDGRRESKLLPRAAALTYATESMRLTTRLMQLASWLLLQRAVNNGEMTLAQADSERSKVKLGVLSSATEGPGWDGLPARLRWLVKRSINLQQRVELLNGALRQGKGEDAPNQVLSQQSRIAAAFAVAR
jgi:regulator of CtrA degradation